MTSEVRQPDVVVVDVAHVHAGGPGRVDDLGGATGNPREDGVEERVVHDLDSPGTQPLGQRDGLVRAPTRRSG